MTLCDTMGFEHGCPSNGPSIRDLEYIMDGHINDRYEFKPGEQIDFKSPFFNANPGPMDKVHVVVLVIDAQSTSTMHPDLVKKLKEITSKANEKDIRWAIVMTKIDSLSSELQDDVTAVFRSEEMETFVEEAHNTFGSISSNIFPMQNYGSQVNASLPINILALHTLENILRLADNTLESQARVLPADAEPTPRIELLDKPWRSVDLTKEGVETMFADLVDIRPDRVPKLRLCLMGPSGDGKSSFVNSAMSEMYQRVVTFAETGGSSAPVTRHYREYLLKQGRDGAELDIELIDTMGLLGSSGGILQEDIITVLDGKVANTTAFNPGSPLTRCDPPVSFADRMHLLVMVVNGRNFWDRGEMPCVYPKELLTKIKVTRDIAKGHPREIPCVVLVSHMDEVCEYVAEDPTMMYRSQAVEKCLQAIHQEVQIPLVDILPIINCHNDTEVDWRKSALVLHALTLMVEKAQDYIAAQVPGETPKKGWFW